MKLLCLLFALTLSAYAVTIQAATIPSATGTALDGHSVALPRDLSPQATILILGFTKNSQSQTTAWEKATRASLAGVTYFDIPFLEDAPGFVRPIILRSLRKQVPDIVKPHFLPLTSGQSVWKQVATFAPTAPDAAYVLLVDHTGTILWQTHDSYSPTLFNQLSQATKNLTAH